jgi:predicted MFS family arabinose efflux permease
MVRKAPGSYVLLFGLASGALLLASLGFWGLKETVSPVAEPRRLGKTLASIPRLLREDRNLRRYITAANLLGLGTVLLPFYVALARRNYGLDQDFLGNLLFIQIGGMIAGNLIWPRVVRARGFKGMMAVWSLLGVLVPLTAVILAGRVPQPLFLGVFTLTGLYLGAQKVTSDAVLMEITDDDNRALYTGVFGTFNLTLALAPVLMGVLVMVLGFTPVFLAASLAALAALPLTRGMVCPADNRGPLSGEPD